MQEMKMKRKPSSKDLNLAVTILSDSVEGISSENLLRALKREALNYKVTNCPGIMLTYQDVSERLSCSKRHVQYLCQKNLLKTRRIGPRAIRVSESDLVSFIENLSE